MLPALRAAFERAGSLRQARLARRGSLKVGARFGGNTRLKAKSSAKRTVRYG